jgi:hypothetical protein
MMARTLGERSAGKADVPFFVENAETVEVRDAGCLAPMSLHFFPAIATASQANMNPDARLGEKWHRSA